MNTGKTWRKTVALLAFAGVSTVPQYALGDSGFRDGTFLYQGRYYKVGTNGTDGDNNSVTITIGDPSLAFAGGYWKKDQSTGTDDSFDSTSGNRLIMDGGDAGWIYGGNARHDGSAIANENSVIINNGNIVGSKPSSGLPNKDIVYGGYAVGFGTGSIAIANSNSVIINGGNINDGVLVGYAGGGTETGYAEACGNSVVVNGGALSGAFGGEASAFRAVSRKNSVIVTGGTVKATGEDAAVIIGGVAETEKLGGVADASYNRVVVQGGSLKNGQNVYGGRSQNPSWWQAELSAENNTVILDGGSLTNIDVVSGMIYDKPNSSSYSAINNRMVILNNPDLSGTYLYGGKLELGTASPSGGAGDVRTGNTLEIHGTGLTAANVQNFENYHFYLSETARAGDTVLTLTDANGTDVKNSNIGVAMDGGASPLQKGDTVTLIRNEAGLASDGYKQVTLTGTQGSTLEHDFVLDADAESINATVAETHATNKSKALSEGYLAGTALALQGADLVAGRGIEAALRAVDTSGVNGVAAFAALSDSHSRYDTGSHVDMNSVSVLTGLALGADTTPGRFTAGVFFEYGNGSYDTYNAFNNASLNGDGHARYVGGGLLARMDFQPVGDGHFYTEASGRAGSLHNEYDNGDLRDARGVKAEYDSSSVYYGMHVGAGYIWDMNEVASLDLYTKYFWTHQESDSMHLSTGERIRFDDVDSSRLRLGGRFAYKINKYVTPYAGAAWEHEFDGKAKATTNGFDIEAPKLAGGTGIGELGISITPSNDLPLSVDLGVQGYVGVREGVTGSVTVKCEF